MEPLIAALKDGYPGVCRDAAEALGQLGDIRAVEPLSAALKDSDKYVCQKAADALGQLGDARAVEPCSTRLCGDTTPSSKLWLEWACSSMYWSFTSATTVPDTRYHWPGRGTRS